MGEGEVGKISTHRRLVDISSRRGGMRIEEALEVEFRRGGLRSKPRLFLRRRQSLPRRLLRRPRAGHNERIIA